jgi:ABC-type multidrug transport system fused ATPase/permease subunit
MKFAKDVSTLIENSLMLGFSFRNGIILFLLSLFSTLVEIFGVTMFLPIFQYVRLNGDIDALLVESSVWEYVIIFFNFIGVEVTLYALLIIAFLLLFGRQIITYIRLIYVATLSAKLSKGLRDRIFSSYLDVEASFYDNMSIGKLINVITTEVKPAIGGVILPTHLILHFVLLISYLSVLIFLSVEMTIASLVVLLFAAYIPKVWINQTATTGREVVNSNSKLSGFLVERLKSPRLVRLSGTEDAEKLEFSSLTENQFSKVIKAAKLHSKTEVVLEPIIIGFSLIFIYVSFTILQMSIEIMGLYLVIMLRLTPVVKGIITLWQSIQYALGSIETVKHRLNLMVQSVEVDNGIQKFSIFNNKIELIDIKYSYPKANKSALTNINFEIAKGSYVAIVGPSGSGKSTLIDVVSRLRKFEKGKILIDNKSINDFSLKSIRRSISYVPQNPQIFNGTIKDHIGYGRNDSKESEIIHAAKISGADSFIQELPEKYNTQIIEDASNFSVGQKQRLELARALVKKSPILILDEPTSNLDAESTKIFLTSLKKILDLGEITVIIVTHYFKDVTNADKIIVINKGVITSEGKHSDLLKKDDWYNESWKIQNQN